MYNIKFLKTTYFSSRINDVSYGFPASSSFWDMCRYICAFMVWFWTLGTDCLVKPSSHLKLEFKVILFTKVRNMFAVCMCLVMSVVFVVRSVTVGLCSGQGHDWNGLFLPISSTFLPIFIPTLSSIKSRYWYSAYAYLTDRLVVLLPVRIPRVSCRITIYYCRFQ
jgi:hypothetical protein